MGLFDFKAKHQQLEAQVADAIEQTTPTKPPQPEPKVTTPDMDLLQSNAANVDKILRRLRSDSDTLEAVIAAKSEQLRQTKVSIEAFAMAYKRLTQVP
jgi:hypothetical protein